MLSRVLAFAITTIFGTSPLALAQETILFRVPRAVTPAEPVVRIQMWAEFSPTDYAFAAVRFALQAEDGVFSETECHSLGGDPCASPPPRHEGRFVHLIIFGQVHYPPVRYADPSNPVLIGYTKWRPDSFEPRDITILTTTGEFMVYPEKESTDGRSAMSTFTEGSAIIRVRRCYADCDGTDDLDFLDFLCFQDAFATDDHYADCDASGELDFFDFLCFQNEFVLGCE